MASIELNSFDGMQPVVSPMLLDANKAVLAQNVQISGGTLQPLLGTTVLKALTKTAPKTIWRYGTSSTETEYWLEFLLDTDVINSPLPNDQWGRVYWTDGVKPKYAVNSQILSGSSYPGASYDLGIPAPTNTPAFTGTSPTVASSGETRAYIETFVSAYGEEGPPGSASSLQTIDPALSCSVTNLTPVPTGNYNITHRRLYRSSTVGSSANWQFVVELPIATLTYTDSVAQGSLGEVLATETWVAPPDDLKGLKMRAGGDCVGFSGNTVYFSEPNLPYAWPNSYPIEFPIVGLGVFQQTVIALTNSYPVALTGVDPAAMSPARMELPQACVSKTSIVDTGDGVLYASPDGLVSIGSQGIQVVTSKHVTRKQWQALNPSSIKAFIHDGRYIAAYTKTDGTRGMLIIDFSGQGPFWTVSDLNSTTAITAGYTDNRSDTLYLAQGTNIVRWNTGDPLVMTWTSPVYRMKQPLNLSHIAVNAASYPVTVKTYADGELIDTVVFADKDFYRLSSGFKATDWQFEIIAANEFTRLRVSSSIQELKAMA